jgi:hypothetical protein
MRGLKALVIIMGVLIVAGFAVIVVTLINRSVGAPPQESGAPVSAVTKSVAATPYKTEIPIPAGATIVETDSGDGRLIIRLRLATGAARILMVDPATGQRVGTIDLPETRP